MEDKKRKLYAYGAFVTVLIAVAGLVYFMMNQQANAAPSERGYYWGPMKAKSGNGYGDEQGRPVNAPSGTTEAPAKQNSVD